MMGPGSMQGDMVLEMELRFLHFELQATGSEWSEMLDLARAYETSKPVPPMTHLLQQGHTS